jgi:hypothetical protein
MRWGRTFILGAAVAVACRSYSGEEETPAPDRDPREDAGGAESGTPGEETDAAIDAGPSPYGPFATVARWKTFDFQKAGMPSAYRGAIYDQRYVYFLPSPWSARIARYDPTLPFDDATSWVVVDISSTLQPVTNRGFAGGAFDGRYIYLPPARQGSIFITPEVVRYDTTLPITDAASWSKFAVSVAPDRSFAGATFDGTYLYLVPNLELSGPGQKSIVRYDTRAPFGEPASWSMSNAVNNCYGGAVFDGRWVTFVPCRPWEFQLQTYQSARFTRYDTTLAWNDANSWQHIGVAAEIAPLPQQQYPGWSSAIWDGKYVYAIGEVGPMLRYEPKDPFIGLSWAQTRDYSGSGQFAMASGAYDGRFIYAIPAFRSVENAKAGWIVRYDTQFPFEANLSWGAFDLRQLDPFQPDGTWAHFIGAAFDGKYMYFAPADDTINSSMTGKLGVRFDVRDPPALPATYRGSWL